MPEFAKVNGSVPGNCYVCGSFEPPFVDLKIDDGVQSIALCGTIFDPTDGTVKRPGCAGEIARVNGNPTHEHVAALNDLLDEQAGMIAELREEAATAGSVRALKDGTLKIVPPTTTESSVGYAGALGGSRGQ